MDNLPFCGILLLLLELGTGGLGQSSVDRIVDGAPIDITEVPYMLSLMINDNHACGAAIIDKEWGLTAAHCVIPIINDPSLSVSTRSGSNYYDTEGVVHNVTLLSYHEKYDESTNKYDIAVFKVNPPFEFNNNTQPIRLPENPELFDTKWGLISGWGYFINENPLLSEHLQYVMVPKVSWDDCVKEYENRFEVTSYQVCYGFKQGGKDACKGDSGGPLVNNFTVIGITSWGAECGLSHSPGVYTDVRHLVDWIKNKITNS